MNISDESFPTDESNLSSYLLHNATDVENTFSGIDAIFLFSAVLVPLINSYVIWLIVTGTGNGVSAEFFILNLNVFEVLICVQFVFIILSDKFEILLLVVYFVNGVTLTARPLLQSVICVERYLAVIHPLTFLKYKPLRYRVICFVFLCILSLASGWVSVILMFQFNYSFTFYLFAQFFLFFSVQLFCCLAVLRALKQSGPGERARERTTENHMKTRAFYFILITTVSMFLLYISFIISIFFLEVDPEVVCVILISFSFVGLVQPLLFLYRVRKLPFIRY